MVTDSISDYLTRLRNALQASHRIVEIPASNVRKRLTEILYEQGFIYKYKFEETSNTQGMIKIALKYNAETKLPAIREISRANRPGLRRYRGAKDIERVMSGLGVAIVSTSKGMMTDKQAKAANVGGEVICYVY